MTSRCHKCGREFLTARSMAGQAIACRSCGALNDGAGGAPPPQPERPAAGAKAAPSKPISGPSFTIGEKPRAVDPRAIDDAYRTAVDAKVAAEVARERGRGGGTARIIRALGIVAFAISALVVGGLFLMRHLGAKPAAINWARYQVAIPQITSDLGTGTGFVIEDKRQLWLVTNFHVIEGCGEVDAIFRSPIDGSELFRVPSIPTGEFRVHPRFLAVKEGAIDDRNYDLAAVSVEAFRPQLEKIGVMPLEVAPAAEIAVGARVVALGHVASSAFDLAADGDADAEGLATHSLFDGLVSSVRRAEGKPTLVQTSANYSLGCSGGPLMLEDSLEVAGVNTWGDVNDDGTAKAGLKFALAADQIFDIIRSGTPLQSVRGEIREAAGEPLPEPGIVDEARAWSTFPGFLDILKMLEADGWKLTGRGIAVTDKDGTGVHGHRVIGSGGVEVAVLALPRDRSIDLDIVEITGQQFRGLGQDLNPAHGTAAAIRVNLPGTDVPAVLQQGFEISIAVQTFFLGESIAARYLIVVLERPAGAGSSVGGANPTAGVGAGAASPSTPPASPPSAPSAPPPSTPPAPTPSTPPATAPSTPPATAPTTPPAPPPSTPPTTP
jgi:S1-C subfamily serine protease